MANRKAFIVDSDTPRKKFEFSGSFKRSFDALINVYADALANLNKVASGKSIKSEYGVCSCDYKLRYVTPNDVSTYVSNLIKGLESGMFHDRVGDVELFTVASVKRFIEDNGCPAFETSSVLDKAHNYVNPKEQTLHDLACICENDIGEIAIYSRGEMLKRLELMKDDIKKINDIHFTANMKKIVSAMPDVLEKSGTMIVENGAYRLTFGTFLEEFLLFVCTLNIIAVLQLIGYAKPTVEYTAKPKNDYSDDLVTECCLINTTDYMVRNRLPFNCNMRDIVLQDVTPDFKDVHDAMHFIMKDPRSPISVLVNKYATKEANREADSCFLGRMFIGANHRHWVDGYYKKDGSQTEDPAKVNGFDTHVNWLDTIAFGNNYLDGNYRRDAVGNNHVNPVMNTLDMVYRVFGGCELKTNEDIANNILRVAGAMRSIVHEYRDGEPIVNYELTKDVLTLLGDILTRNMLRLYYNNTRVFSYEDNMPDAAAPGFVCMESFVMEAGEQNNTSGNNTNNNANGGNTNNANANGQKSGVTFTNNQGQNLQGNKTNVSGFIQKLLDWITNQLAKFSGNFEKKYKSYIDYVNKNKAVNDQIAKAISEGSFIPNLNNIPDYKLSLDRFKKCMSKDEVGRLLDVNVTKEFEPNAYALKFLGIDDSIIKEIQSSQQQSNNVKDKSNAAVEAVTNYFLSGKTKVDMINGKLDTNKWKEICDDLLNCSDFVKQATATLSSAATAAGEAVKAKLAEAESKNDGNTTARCDAVSKSIKTATDVYERNILIALGSKFFASRYNLYREIVSGFSQQNNNNNNNNGNTDSGQQTQSEQPTDMNA